MEAETSDNVYVEAKKYWEGVPATVSGMLDGLTQISSVDLAASSKFINHFIQDPVIQLQPQHALDCGSGIGRVTKRLLLPIFKTVDMVDINQAFLDEARSFLGKDASRVKQYFCSSLHQFEPSPGQYNAIWCQWVLGHLTEDDLVAFFRRCKSGLTENGILFFKENINSNDESEFDEKDHSWIRSRSDWLRLVDRAGLKVIKEEMQPSFPKDLYDVRMFALC